MKALVVSVLAVFALAGCNSLPFDLPGKGKRQDRPAMQPKANAHHHGKTKTFVCNNDAQPVIRRINEDQIELIVDGRGTIMNAAVSGSGERYVSQTGVYGKGGEWHQKADEATFTYHDVGSPAQCRVK